MKLDAVEYYLRFYTKALKGKPTTSKPFELWYIDAFAGSGSRTTEEEVGGLLEGRPASTEIVQRAGSASRALSIHPPFHKFVFVEKDADRCAALRSLQIKHSDRDIQCIQDDANAVLPNLFRKEPWINRHWGDPAPRGVVFLDPYDIIEWSTLAALAATKAIDLWFLFPIGSVIRQAANDFSAVDVHKAAYLDRAFGTCDWRTELYVDTAGGSLFDEHPASPTRVARAGVEAYMKKRLETLFPYVSSPLPLLTTNGAQLFSLYFTVANPSTVAINLAKNCVKDLVKSYGRPAFRRRSDP